MVQTLSLVGAAFAVGGSYFALDSLRDVLIAKTINTPVATRLAMASAAVIGGLFLFGRSEGSAAGQRAKDTAKEEIIAKIEAASEQFAAEPDDPNYMVKSDIHKIAESGIRMTVLIGEYPDADLPVWLKSKLSVAASEADGVADNMGYALADPEAFDAEGFGNSHINKYTWNTDPYLNRSNTLTKEEARTLLETTTKPIKIRVGRSSTLHVGRAKVLPNTPQVIGRDEALAFFDNEGGSYVGVSLWEYDDHIFLNATTYDEMWAESFDAEGRGSRRDLGRFTRPHKPSAGHYRRKGRRSALRSIFSADTGSCGHPLTDDNVTFEHIAECLNCGGRIDYVDQQSGSAMGDDEFMNYIITHCPRCDRTVAPDEIAMSTEVFCKQCGASFSAESDDWPADVELAIGTHEELEHTDNAGEARRIAQDHLDENPNYYEILTSAGLVGRNLPPNRVAQTIRQVVALNTQKRGQPAGNAWIWTPLFHPRTSEDAMAQVINIVAAIPDDGGMFHHSQFPSEEWAYLDDDSGMLHLITVSTHSGWKHLMVNIVDGTAKQSTIPTGFMRMIGRERRARSAFTDKNAEGDDDDGDLVPDKGPRRGAPDLWFSEDSDPYCHLYEKTQRWDDGRYRCGERKGHAGRCSAWSRSGSGKQSFDGYPPCEHIKAGQRDCGCILGDGVDDSIGARLGNHPLFRKKSAEGGYTCAFCGDGFPSAYPPEYATEGMERADFCSSSCMEEYYGHPSYEWCPDESCGHRHFDIPHQKPNTGCESCHAIESRKKSAEESINECGLKGRDCYACRGCGRCQDCTIVDGYSISSGDVYCVDCSKYRESKESVAVGTKFTCDCGAKCTVDADTEIAYGPGGYDLRCGRNDDCRGDEKVLGAEVFEAFSISDRPVSVKFGTGTSGNAKMKAVFTDASGDTKTTQFGYRGMSDYTKHKDADRRSSYLARHGSKAQGENWKDPTTAGALSRYVLWEKTSLPAAKSAFKKRFNLRAEGSSTDEDDIYIGYQVSPFITEWDRSAIWTYETDYSITEESL